MVFVYYSCYKCLKNLTFSICLTLNQGKGWDLDCLRHLKNQMNVCFFYRIVHLIANPLMLNELVLFFFFPHYRWKYQHIFYDFVS